MNPHTHTIFFLFAPGYACSASSLYILQIVVTHRSCSAPGYACSATNNYHHDTILVLSFIINRTGRIIYFHECINEKTHTQQSTAY